MDFKIDLFSFLDRKGMTQSQLAGLLGTSPANVNRWATGDGVPSHSLCRKLLVEGMTVKELFGIDVHDEGHVGMDESEFETRVRDCLVKVLKK